MEMGNASALLLLRGEVFGLHVPTVVQQVLLNTVLLNGPSSNRCDTFCFPGPLLQLFAFRECNVCFLLAIILMIILLA